ncbi:DUF1508 domain-containing protein [Cryobacterium sp. TMT2-18-3]|uniref:YegP family protein n=2 Tax=unclassified Cryobacterium TaxID=2649013 RepID=UPI00106C5113|nr:DUF1508 domain-containing protein [Cryobacterium sp. TMT2-18-2]TFC39557.1 DUF1508 domain-containing protein [Cryobacterium sp. TMT2-42-4]TFC61526.1 DUF1508 domain-containing protein [Cryobacterium sp. TMT2-18-3]
MPVPSARPARAPSVPSTRLRTKNGTRAVMRKGFPSGRRSWSIICRRICARPVPADSHWHAPRFLYPALIPGGRVSKPVVWSAPGLGQGCDMAGRFTIYRDQSGNYRFCFSADNGQSIPSPETYRTEDEARKKVDSLRSNVSPRSRRTH